jgi:hypothetical protein
MLAGGRGGARPRAQALDLDSERAGMTSTPSGPGALAEREPVPMTSARPGAWRWSYSPIAQELQELGPPVPGRRRPGRA